MGGTHIRTPEETEQVQQSLTLEHVKIPIGNLEVSPLNMRAEMPPDGDIQNLATDILNRGVLSPLVVRKNPNESDSYEVICGRRRLYALRHIANGDASLIDVPCMLIPNPDEDQESRAASLSENINRMPVGPVETFEAFQALSQEGMSHADIGANFGFTESRVRAILALSRVHPEILEAAREKKISHARLRAFAMTPDQNTQLREFHADPESRIPVDQLRAQLTSGTMPANHPMARFVGLQAYQEAGGTLVETLFTYDGSQESGIADDAVLEDGALVVKLANKALHKEAQSVEAEGWETVHVEPNVGDAEALIARFVPCEQPDALALSPEERANRIAVVTINPNYEPEQESSEAPPVVIVRGLQTPEGRSLSELTREAQESNREAALEGSREGHPGALIDQEEAHPGSTSYQDHYQDHYQDQEETPSAPDIHVQPKDDPARIRPALERELIEIRREIMVDVLAKAPKEDILRWTILELNLSTTSDPEALFRDQNRDPKRINENHLPVEIANLGTSLPDNGEAIQAMIQTLQEAPPDEIPNLIADAATAALKVANPTAPALQRMIQLFSLDPVALWRPDERYFKGFPLKGLALLLVQITGDSQAGRKLHQQKGGIENAALIMKELCLGNTEPACQADFPAERAKEISQTMSQWIPHGLLPRDLPRARA